jgi:hypothetical protein
MFSFEIESGKAECYGTVVPSLPMCVRVCVYGMYTAHFLAPHSFPVYVCVIRQRGRGCVGDKEELSWTLGFTYDEASGLLDVSPEYNTSHIPFVARLSRFFCWGNGVRGIGIGEATTMPYY